MKYQTEYILEQLDRGFGLEFIAKDANIKIESLVSRLRKAEKDGLLEQRYVFILNRFLGVIENRGGK